MSESNVPRMAPSTQVRVGKAMQLLSIALLGAMLTTMFVLIGTGQQQKAIPLALPLWMIYSVGVGYWGTELTKKGHQRQAAADKAARKAAEKQAVEQGPLVCRTGAEHIWLGEDTACFNGCGATRYDVARHRDQAR